MASGVCGCMRGWVRGCAGVWVGGWVQMLLSRGDPTGQSAQTGRQRRAQAAQAESTPDRDHTRHGPHQTQMPAGSQPCLCASILLWRTGEAEVQLGKLAANHFRHAVDAAVRGRVEVGEAAAEDGRNWVVQEADVAGVQEEGGARAGAA